MVPTLGVLRLAVWFLILVAIFLVVLETEAMWRVVRGPYCSWIAGTSVGLLQSFGLEFQVSGAAISGEGLRAS